MIAKEIGPVPASAPESSGHHERNGHVPTKRKPKSLAVLAENILEHLKRLRIWVGWRWELRKGKWAKVPIDVKTGKRARSNKHATWSSFQEAWDFYRLASNETDGIGIVLDHPVDGLVGVDLDRCVAADQLNDKARSILIDLDTYAELSPSGTGAKALALLDAPGLARGFNNREAGVEMYDRGRFWTITGHPLVPFSKGLSNRTVVVKQLFERYATTAPSPLSNGQVIGERKKPRNKLSDAEVLERARRAKNGQRFSAVYDGKLTRATDGPLCSPAFKRPFRSASEVDAALCRMIAFYTGDNLEQIERIVSGSPWARNDSSKWLARQDYRDRTISMVLDALDKVYTPPDRSLPDDPHRLARVYLNCGKEEEAHVLKVKFSKGNFWQWRHNRYQHVKKDSMKARLSGAIHEEFCRQQREAEKLAPPSKPPMTQPVRARDVHDTLTALSGMTRIADDIELGSWLVDRETGQKRNLLPCHNGIVDLDAILDGALVDDPKVLLAHTPQLFSSVCLPYDYDPTATCPEFVRFLHQVLEGDLERIDLLLEFFGYTLTPDNAYQRYLMLYGFGCNGKTVVDTVLSEMLGDQNTSRVSLHRFSDRFSAFQMVLYFPRLR